MSVKDFVELASEKHPKTTIIVLLAVLVVGGVIGGLWISDLHTRGENADKYADREVALANRENSLKLAEAESKHRSEIENLKKRVAKLEGSNGAIEDYLSRATALVTSHLDQDAILRNRLFDVVQPNVAGKSKTQAEGLFQEMALERERTKYEHDRASKLLEKELAAVATSISIVTSGSTHNGAVMAETMPNHLPLLYQFPNLIFGVLVYGIIALVIGSIFAAGLVAGKLSRK